MPRRRDQRVYQQAVCANGACSVMEPLTGAGIHILTHSSAPCCCRDQRVYKQAVGVDGAFSAPEPLTGADSQHRYADAVIDKRFDRLVAVREDHSGEGEPVNSVAAVGAQS